MANDFIFNRNYFMGVQLQSEGVHFSFKGVHILCHKKTEGG